MTLLKNKKDKKIIVIGGGLSGSAIGYLFKQAGYKDINIIEKEDNLGGLCRTYKIGVNKYEFGPHIFHSDKPDVNKIIKKLMIYHEVRPIVKSCPFDDLNNLFDYPLTISNILKLENKEDIIYELYNLNPKNLDHTNFETYVKSIVGTTLYDIFIKNYNIKQWGINPKEMSSKWAPKRISFRKNNKLLFHNMWSIYPVNGYNEFFNKLTRNISILKGDFKELIIKNNNVLSIRLKNNEIVEGDLFVSTIPINLLFNSSKKLTYRGVYKSFVQIEKKKLLKALWYTFPNHHNFTRIMEYKGYTLENNNTTVLSMAFPFNSQDINKIPEKEWDLESIDFLKKKFYIKDSEIINQFHMKDPYAYPLATDENEENFMRLLKHLVKFNNLFSLGRLGLFIYVPMHICMKQCIRLKNFIEIYETLKFSERIQKYLELR